MASFDINKKISCTYRYGEDNKNYFVEGFFFNNNEPLNVELKVIRDSKEDALNELHRLADILGNQLG